MSASATTLRTKRAPPPQFQALERSKLPLALALTVASGCAALGHELLWTRRLTDLLGARTLAAARVFGCFFLGLALGAALAARAAEGIKRPWRFVALAEAAVAVLSVPALLLPEWTQWIWPALGPERLLGWQGAAAKLALSLLVVTPPALAMGLALPWLVKAAVATPPDRQRQVVWLYSANTAGGIAGLVVTSLVALEIWGVRGTMVVMIWINLAVAMVAWLADGLGGPANLVPTGPRPNANPLWLVKLVRQHSPLLAAVAFMSGFGVLAVEVVFFQLFQLSAIISVQATTAMLVSVLLPLAAAAFLVPAVAVKVKSPKRLLGPSLSVAALGIAVTPLLFMSQRVQQMIVSQNATLAGVQCKLIAASLMTLGPAIFAAGTVLPLVLYLGEGATTTAAGQRVGWLLAWNGLGGLGGAEFAYRWVLPASGVNQGMGAIAGLYALTALLVAWAVSRTFSAEVSLALAGATLVAALGLTKLGGLPQINDKFGLRALWISNGRDGAIAVVEHPSFGRGILVQNQYLLGATGAAHEQARQALLPMLLHPAPRRVALIGLATGSTAVGALRDKAAEQITAIEISGSVVDAARRFFAEANAETFSDPRTRIVVEDGRTYLAACRERFDVIVGDLFLPWKPGTGRLYSEEHFAAVRRALAPGGVFCQWLPMYQFTPDQFDVCVATLERVFVEVQLFRGNLDATHPLLGLVAWKEGSLDWEVITNHCKALCKGNLHDALLRHPEGLALLYLGRAPGSAPEARVNTLGDPWLELNAGRERLTGDPASKYLMHDRWLKFSQAQIARSATNEPAQAGLVSLQIIGQRAALAQAYQARGQAIPPELLRSLRAQTLVALRADQEADWSAWPGLSAVWKK